MNDKCYDNLTPLQKVFAQVWLAYINDMRLDGEETGEILREAGMAEMRVVTEEEAEVWGWTVGSVALLPTAEGADILKRVP